MLAHDCHMTTWGHKPIKTSSLSAPLQKLNDGLQIAFFLDIKTSKTPRQIIKNEYLREKQNLNNNEAVKYKPLTCVQLICWHNHPELVYP